MKAWFAYWWPLAAIVALFFGLLTPFLAGVIETPRNASIRLRREWHEKHGWAEDETGLYKHRVSGGWLYKHYDGNAVVFVPDVTPAEKPR